ncbi:MAG: hypothetical protein U5R31_05555 [Acidimicrobiia bacterium]|nr:hypothetical protein [Acidimicrobiia bacterium]
MQHDRRDGRRRVPESRRSRRSSAATCRARGRGDWFDWPGGDEGYLEAVRAARRSGQWTGENTLHTIDGRTVEVHR